MPETGRTLVTGALGCLGAWTLKALLDDGEEPVGYDLGSDDSRLRIVLDHDERERVTLIQGDVTDGAALGRALDEHDITAVVHLAALQVPFCRADPALGARVNVLGTVVVFEALKARRERLPGLAYASSTAVFNASDPSPAPESGGTAPGTLYGVYKLANEGTARVFWQDEGVCVDRDPPVRRLRAGTGPGHDLLPHARHGRRRTRRAVRDPVRRHGPVRLRARRGQGLRACRQGGPRRRPRRELPGRAVHDARGRRRDRGGVARRRRHDYVEWRRSFHSRKRSSPVGSSSSSALFATPPFRRASRVPSSGFVS